MSISEFKSAELVTSDKLTDILAVWKQLAADRFAPRREEITPTKFRTLLPWVWIVDVAESGEDFRFRIAGDRIIEYLGGRHAGKNLSELRGPSFFELMNELFRYSVRYKRPIAHGPLQSSHAKREHLEAEVLVLPLSDDGINVTALCGGFDYWPYGTHFHKVSAQQSAV
jgi:hypothetical protein